MAKSKCGARPTRSFPGLVVAASVVIALVLPAFPSRWPCISLTPRPELMLRLLRVMFPYMLLVCLAAAMMGMLNARGHFFIPAMGATMLNVVMIASVFWLAPKFGVGLPKEQRLPVQIFALAYRRAGGGRGAGGVSTADALARRLSLPLGFAVAR